MGKRAAFIESEGNQGEAEGEKEGEKKACGPYVKRCHGGKAKGLNRRRSPRQDKKNKGAFKSRPRFN